MSACCYCTTLRCGMIAIQTTIHQCSNEVHISHDRLLIAQPSTTCENCRRIAAQYKNKLYNTVDIR